MYTKIHRLISYISHVRGDHPANPSTPPAVLKIHNKFGHLFASEG